MPEVILSQRAPFPGALKEIVESMSYRPGWSFRLANIDRGQGSAGLTFIVTSCGYDTYHPDRGETYRVLHYMLVPPAAYDRRSWLQWVLDQLLLIERHETCEFLQVNGERPFMPLHQPGSDPYMLVTLSASEAERHTDFRGKMHDVGGATNAR